MTIDFKSEDDEVEQQQCTKGHVYALAQRDPEARGERKAPAKQMGLSGFLGGEPEEARKPAKKKRQCFRTAF